MVNRLTSSAAVIGHQPKRIQIQGSGHLSRHSLQMPQQILVFIRRRQKARDMFLGTTKTCVGALGLISLNTRLRSSSKISCEGISFAAIRQNRQEPIEYLSYYTKAFPNKAKNLTPAQQIHLIFLSVAPQRREWESSRQVQ